MAESSGPGKKHWWVIVANHLEGSSDDDSAEQDTKVADLSDDEGDRLDDVAATAEAGAFASDLAMLGLPETAIAGAPDATPAPAAPAATAAPLPMAAPASAPIDPAPVNPTAAILAGQQAAMQQRQAQQEAARTKAMLGQYSETLRQMQAQMQTMQAQRTEAQQTAGALAATAGARVMRARADDASMRLYDDAHMQQKHNEDTRALRQQHDRLRMQVEQLREQYDRAQRQVSEANLRAAHAEQAVEANRTQMAQATNQLLEKLRAKAEARVASLVRGLESKNRELAERVTRAETIADDAQQEFAETQTDHDKERQDLEDQIASLQRQNEADTRVLIDEARAKDAAIIQTMQREYRDAQAERDRLAAQYRQSQGAYAAIEASREALRDQLRELEQEVQRAQEQGQAHFQLYTKAESDCDARVKTKVAMLQQRLEAAENDAEKAHADAERAQAGFKEQQARLQQELQKAEGLERVMMATKDETDRVRTQCAQEKIRMSEEMARQLQAYKEQAQESGGEARKLREQIAKETQAAQQQALALRKALSEAQRAMKDRLAPAQQEIESLRQALQQHQDEILSLRAAQQDVEAARNAAEQQVEGMRGQLLEASRQLAQERKESEQRLRRAGREYDERLAAAQKEAEEAVSAIRSKLHEAEESNAQQMEALVKSHKEQLRRRQDDHDAEMDRVRGVSHSKALQAVFDHARTSGDDVVKRLTQAATSAKADHDLALAAARMDTSRQPTWAPSSSPSDPEAVARVSAGAYGATPEALEGAEQAMETLSRAAARAYALADTVRAQAMHYESEHGRWAAEVESIEGRAAEAAATAYELATRADDVAMAADAGDYDDIDVDNCREMAADARAQANGFDSALSRATATRDASSVRANQARAAQVSLSAAGDAAASEFQDIRGASSKAQTLAQKLRKERDLALSKARASADVAQASRADSLQARQHLDARTDELREANEALRKARSDHAQSVAASDHLRALLLHADSGAARDAAAEIGGSALARTDAAQQRLRAEEMRLQLQRAEARHAGAQSRLQQVQARLTECRAKALEQEARVRDLRAKAITSSPMPDDSFDFAAAAYAQAYGDDPEEAATGSASEPGVAQSDIEEVSRGAEEAQLQYSQALRERSSATIDERCARGECEALREQIPVDVSAEEIAEKASHTDLIQMWLHAQHRLKQHENASETMYGYNNALAAGLDTMSAALRRAEARASKAEEDAKASHVRLSKLETEKKTEPDSQAFLEEAAARAKAAHHAEIAATRKASREATERSYRRFRQAEVALRQANEDQRERHEREMDAMQREWSADRARAAQMVLSKEGRRGDAASKAEEALEAMRRRHQDEVIELKKQSKTALAEADRAHQEVLSAAESRVHAAEASAQEQLQRVAESERAAGEAAAHRSHQKAYSDLKAAMVSSLAEAEGHKREANRLRAEIATAEGLEAQLAALRSRLADEKQKNTKLETEMQELARTVRSCRSQGVEAQKMLEDRARELRDKEREAMSRHRDALDAVKRQQARAALADESEAAATSTARAQALETSAVAASMQAAQAYSDAMQEFAPLRANVAVKTAAAYVLASGACGVQPAEDAAANVNAGAYLGADGMQTDLAFRAEVSVQMAQVGQYVDSLLDV